MGKDRRAGIEEQARGLAGTRNEEIDREIEAEARETERERAAD